MMVAMVEGWNGRGWWWWCTLVGPRVGFGTSAVVVVVVCEGQCRCNPVLSSLERCMQGATRTKNGLVAGCMDGDDSERMWGWGDEWKQSRQGGRKSEEGRG